MSKELNFNIVYTIANQKWFRNIQTCLKVSKFDKNKFLFQIIYGFLETGYSAQDSRKLKLLKKTKLYEKIFLVLKYTVIKKFRPAFGTN